MATFSNISNTSSCVANVLSQGGQNNDEQIKQLKKINHQVENLESSLRNVNLIKGNANALLKLKTDINKQIGKIGPVPSTNSQFQKSEDSPKLVAFYREDWYSCLDFKFEDAAQQRNKYTDSDGNDISHIYSYNKVMSIPDRRDISKILNRTNFKIMAWYFGPRDSAASGLKRFRLAYKMPMQSTGK